MIQHMVQGVPFAAAGALFGISLCWGWGRLKQRLLWLEHRRESKRREWQADEFESCALVIRSSSPSVRVERYNVPASCSLSSTPAAAAAARQQGSLEVASPKAVARVAPRPVAAAISPHREPAEDHEETCHLIRVLEDVLVPEDGDGTACKAVSPSDRVRRAAPLRGETRLFCGAAPIAAHATASVAAPAADESAVRRVRALWLQEPSRDECDEFTALHVRSGDVQDVTAPRVQEHESRVQDSAIPPGASEAETCVIELLSTFEVRQRLAELGGEA